MERKGDAGGVRVYDSYAHHPAEIAGDLQAARAVAGEGRVVVVFQPHLVSRTRLLGAEMGVALGAADEVVVLDVYLAREEADPAVTGALVADAVPLPRERVAYVADLASAPAERGRAGPARRPGAHPRRGHRDRARSADPRAAGEPAMADARKRFARRQWARRWLTWRYVLALLLVLVVAVGGALPGLLLQHPVRAGRRGLRHPDAQREEGPRGGRRTDRAGRWRPSTWTRSPTGCGPWPWSSRPRSPASGRTTYSSRSWSGSPSRWSRSPGSCTASTRRAWCSAATTAPPTDSRGSAPSRA